MNLIGRAKVKAFVPEKRSGLKLQKLKEKKSKTNERQFNGLTPKFEIYSQRCI